MTLVTVRNRPALPKSGEIQHSHCLGKIQAVDDDNATITAIVSTINVDRGDDIILPPAYEKRIGSFKRNPVHLWAHKQDLPQYVIGRAIPDSIKILSNGLLVTFVYDVEDDFARGVYGKYKRGILNAYSVGVDPFAWLLPNKLPDDVKELLAKEGVDPDLARVVYTDVEMWEVSACGVPMNRESLVIGRSASTEISKEASDMHKTADAPGMVTQKTGVAPSTKAHARGLDIAARLHAAANNIAGWYGYSSDDDAPPDADVCRDTVEILMEITEDLAELAGVANGASSADDPKSGGAGTESLTGKTVGKGTEKTGSATTATPTPPIANSGAVLSADNVKHLSAIVAHANKAMAYCTKAVDRCTQMAKDADVTLDMDISEDDDDDADPQDPEESVNQDPNDEPKDGDEDDRNKAVTLKWDL